MVTPLELFGSSSQRTSVGSIEINTEYETCRKPIWLVSLKLLGVVAVIAVAFAIALPSVPLPLWQSVLVILGLFLLYVGIAFFIRPEPNTDNLGWAGGLMNNPFSYADNLNRNLFALYAALGPGRFVAGTILDVCVLLGWMSEPRGLPSVPDEAIERTLARTRLARLNADPRTAGTVPMDSARFLNQG